MFDVDVVREVGRVGKLARVKAKHWIRPGVKLLDVAERVEGFILDQGFVPAFPVNITLNSLAAHDTPRVGDDRVFVRGDLVKVDVGACDFESGVLSDTASTYCVGSNEHGRIIEASERALSEVVKVVREGVSNGVIGGVIFDTVVSHGFRVVKNLVGHGIGAFNVHTGISFPPFRGGRDRVERGLLFAVEPYATNGDGFAVSAGRVEIFGLNELRPVRLSSARKLVEWVVENRKSLPFCKRWLVPVFGDRTDSLVNYLVRLGVFKEYDVLKERGGGLVSQAEHTFFVSDSGEVIVSTL